MDFSEKTAANCKYDPGNYIAIGGNTQVVYDLSKSLSPLYLDNEYDFAIVFSFVQSYNGIKDCTE